jgi:hypothetical protein
MVIRFLKEKGENGTVDVKEPYSCLTTNNINYLASKCSINHKFGTQPSARLLVCIYAINAECIFRVIFYSLSWKLRSAFGYFTLL